MDKNAAWIKASSVCNLCVREPLSHMGILTVEEDKPDGWVSRVLLRASSCILLVTSQYHKNVMKWMVF